MKRKTRQSPALRYHSKHPAGKLSVQPTKSCATQSDLALAYTPGVAEPVREIMRDERASYNYTNRGNLVAVITNGTAVLGLGNTGAAASKPVMEGKAVLFKRFAGIDAFDLEIAETDPDKFVSIVSSLAPTFGGINLEDIAAPACFYIEDALKRKLNIPVFHDDQHGTAVIAGAALLNALTLVGKKISKVHIVITGAGAAGMRCAEHFARLGVTKSHITILDQHGVLHQERNDLQPIQQPFARTTAARTLDEAILNADVFLGVSAPNILTADMIRTMATQPIVFALANPDPEIAYPHAKQARHDILVATGRSDYPNQINNVLGFPAMFRGALDVRAETITDGMKLAATHALANLAQLPVPKSVATVYREKHLEFGKDYIVPKPFDPRVLVHVAVAVAKAAMADGVAQKRVTLKAYTAQLTTLSGKLNQ